MKCPPALLLCLSVYRLLKLSLLTLLVLLLQLSVVESSRDQGLYALNGELTNAKALLTKLDEAAHR